MHGGDQDARQTMFASQVPEYLDDDQLGTDATHGAGQLRHQPSAVPEISGWPQLTERHPALRNGAQQVRYASDGPGVFAFSRIDRDAAARVRRGAQQQRGSADGRGADLRRATATFQRVYGAGAGSLADRRPTGRLPVTVPALSDRGLRVGRAHPALHAAPAVALAAAGARRRDAAAGCRSRPTSAAPRSTR